MISLLNPFQSDLGYEFSNFKNSSMTKWNECVDHPANLEVNPNCSYINN